MTYDYLGWCIDAFKDHVTVQQQKEETTGFTHLQDYLIDWLEYGDAVEKTASFATYLRVVVLVIDEWSKDATLERHLDRPVTGIIDAESTGSLFIDPDYFASVALKKQLMPQAVETVAMPPLEPPDEQ